MPVSKKQANNFESQFYDLNGANKPYEGDRHHLIQKIGMLDTN